jgi:hypothetical protein
MPVSIGSVAPFLVLFLLTASVIEDRNIKRTREEGKYKFARFIRTVDWRKK